VSKQKDVLPGVVERLSKDNPGCGVILHGSVQRGYERSESDIDLFAITEEGSMTTHLEILPEVVEILVREHPVSGIAYHGSALLGCARPDSDLDLIILVDAPGEYRNDHAVTHKGIVLCRSFLPREWLEKSLAKSPYMLFPFSQARIVYDPDGLTAQLQATAAAYFERKPEIAAAWAERTAAYRARKTDTSIEIPNPSWGEFFKWLCDKHDVA
jgi:predicted nucleotidyltransferase